MNGDNERKVRSIYPDALVHRWEGKKAVSVDRNGMIILGLGKNPCEAWAKAARGMRHQNYDVIYLGYLI